MSVTNVNLVAVGLVCDLMDLAAVDPGQPGSERL